MTGVTQARRRQRAKAARQALALCEAEFRLKSRVSTGTARAALCADADPDAWFLERGKQAAIAMRICGACPARVQCLDYALSGADTWGGISTGIWGGTTPGERARIRRAWKAAAA